MQIKNILENMPIRNWWIERFKQDGCALFTDEIK